MKLAVYVFAAALAACTPAHADCDHFKWSVAHELQWFKAGPTALPAQGGEASPNTGYAVTLAKDVKLPFPPERAPGKDSFGAVVNVPKLDAGLYQITLSAEAWIDVAQNGAVVKSNDFSGQRDCPGVRKTVRFTLGAGPATVQISNAAAATIDFAVAPSQ